METNNTTLIVGLLLLIVGLGVGYVFGGNQFPYQMPFGMMGGNNTMMAGQNIDRHFIEQMIPHHEGAIAMAELASLRSKRPEILSLAEDIIEAQTSEIEKMQAWYENWFGGVVSDSSLGRGMMHMRGMEGDLDELSAAKDFDLEFIEQMIPHHEMAIMMASMLLAQTVRPEMQELADQIITSQSHEITMMQSWYRAWIQG